jgi:ABC-type multidrug transport system fused ATPase/permease subunit
VDANPFRSARAYLAFSPGIKWGALVCSVLSPVCLALLFPLLFLFADLLVTRGDVPDYADLPGTRRAAFRDEWDARLKDEPAVQDANARLHTKYSLTPPEEQEWAVRWQAATHARLATAVGPEAADLYIPADETVPQSLTTPSGKKLGILALVARERTPWPGSLIAAFARANPWTWRPDSSGSASVPYLSGLLLIAVALIVLRGALLYGAAYWSTRATIGASTRLRRTIYNHAYRLSAVAVKPEAQAEVADLVTRRVEQVHEGLYLWLTASARRPVLIALLLVFLFSVQPWLTLCLVLLATTVWLVAGQLAAW